MYETKQQIAAALRASLIFPLLGPADGERFVASAKARSWRAGETIFPMGEVGESMMLVQTGEVRISHPAANGRAIVLSELKPGAIFGEIALLDGGPRTADAVAATNCTLLVFSRQALVALLKNNWPLTEALLKLVCARLRGADERIADLAFVDLPTRLAKELLARATPGAKGAPSRVSDKQSALAALVGGSRETVNRCLKAWEKAGLVKMAEGRIVLLDTEGLARIGR